MLKVLSPSDVDAFIERGFVRVESAYDPQDALAAQQEVWRHLEEQGIVQNDPSTWQKSLVRLNEGYDSPEFERCNTARLADAMEDLVGRGQLRQRSTTAWGWWPVNFSLGSDVPWDVPRQGWHWDGQHFRHYVDSPEQGLLVLCVFSDIAPQGGGTLVVEGSHQVVAKFLARHPQGMEHKAAIAEVVTTHPYFRSLTATVQAEPAEPGERIERFMQPHVDEDGITLRVVETTAHPGDVYLCHPFLFHATSQNHRHVPRFMCNRTAALKDRMRVFGPSDSRRLSPVEESIRRALG